MLILHPHLKLRHTAHLPVILRSRPLYILPTIPRHIHYPFPQRLPGVKQLPVRRLVRELQRNITLSICRDHVRLVNHNRRLKWRALARQVCSLTRNVGRVELEMLSKLVRHQSLQAGSFPSWSLTHPWKLKLRSALYLPYPFHWRLYRTSADCNSPYTLSMD